MPGSRTAAQTTKSWAGDWKWSTTASGRSSATPKEPKTSSFGLKHIRTILRLGHAVGQGRPFCESRFCESRFCESRLCNRGQNQQWAAPVQELPTSCRGDYRRSTSSRSKDETSGQWPRGLRPGANARPNVLRRPTMMHRCRPCNRGPHRKL